MLWYKQVEKHDVAEAYRLLEVAMQQSATDHSTGNFISNCIVLFCNQDLKMIYLFPKELLTWTSSTLEFLPAKE